MDLFKIRLKIHDHFVFLKRCLFLEDGEFGESFSSSLFHQVVLQLLAIL